MDPLLPPSIQVPPLPAVRLAALIGCLHRQNSLSSEEKESLFHQLSAKLKDYPSPVWCPQAGPQSAAYLSEADELFFGGAAGGGKSDMLLGLGLTGHVRSLILRNEGSQLEKFKQRLNLLERKGDRWKGIGIHGGTFHTVDGRMIELNGCKTLADANSKFRGRDHDLKAFDELPTIPKAVYTFINGWCRTDIIGQRCRIVATGNPPTTPQEEWVLDYWGPWLRDKTAAPGELQWYAPVGPRGDVIRVESGDPIYLNPKGDPILPRSRTFIPATLEDNPIYVATGYKRTLQGIDDPVLREQLLRGDMEAGLQDDPNQIIPTEWVDMAMARWKEKSSRDPRRLSAMGIDPARGGKDRFTVAKRYENWIAPIVEIPGKEVPNGRLGAMRVLMELDYPHAAVIIDITGTAGGDLFGVLTLVNPQLPVYAFVASGRSEYRDDSMKLRMRNKRTEMYWRLRDALNPRNPNPLELPPNRELRAELTAHRAYVYVEGIGVEDKDEIIKRVGRSPDLADALAMSLMDVDILGGWNQAPIPTQQTTTFAGSVLPTNPVKYLDRKETIHDNDAGEKPNKSGYLNWG